MKQRHTPSSKNDREIAYWKQNKLICGIDEVGRGCLAGPIIACCTILFPYSDHPLLVDSKILTETKRRDVALWLQSNSWYAFGVISPYIIDKQNIYRATQIAMKRAFFGLYMHPFIPQPPECVLIDAMPLELPVKTESFIKGESHSISIAAASILAKVYRDELITRFDTTFPGYSFDKNKGYGAPTHQTALHKKGTSLAHRNSFLSSFISHPTQQSLF